MFIKGLSPKLLALVMNEFTKEGTGVCVLMYVEDIVILVGESLITKLKKLESLCFCIARLNTYNIITIYYLITPQMIYNDQIEKCSSVCCILYLYFL